MSFLDLPDLACLAQACPGLLPLVNDPVLRRERLLVVAPSRVAHSLFGTSTSGLPLRPTLPDLVHRGIIRGMGIERRWRDGLYFASALVRPGLMSPPSDLLTRSLPASSLSLMRLSHAQMVRQYESSMRLQWTHARNVVAHALRARPSPAARAAFYRALVLPRDMPEADVSPAIVPAVRRLRWALRRDRLAHFVKDRSEMVKNGSLGKWLEGDGRVVMWRENERVRLALCPGIKGIVRFYEGLSR